ncbi:MAG: site-specific DNA-methyltransferase, partial [Gemmatimonadales bacterium]
MSTLHELLAAKVAEWRTAGYPSESFPAVAEVLRVERTRTDGFFDGTLGHSLVKIASFTHPLAPLDLEDLKRELDARPEEDRPVTVACLGIELAAQGWVDEWNALRKGAAAVNKIQVIELRSDPKYGKFIRHEPARAKINIDRTQDKVLVENPDFNSPTVVERLKQQAG